MEKVKFREIKELAPNPTEVKWQVTSRTGAV